jgi:hypothetical protein
MLSKTFVAAARSGAAGAGAGAGADAAAAATGAGAGVGAGAGLKLTTVFIDMLEPRPEEIAQDGRQLLQLQFNPYFLSPYATLASSTRVRLPPSTAPRAEPEAFSRAPAPVAVEGPGKLKYGVYSDVKPYSVAVATVLFEHTAALPTFESVVREVDVSLWSGISVDERYTLQNVGAGLKGGFSRDEYASKGATGNSVRGLTALLPIDAHGVYYRDESGNISTSHLRRDTELNAAVLDIELRYPLFGGWRASFSQGYRLAATSGGSAGAGAPYLVPVSDSDSDKGLVRLIVPLVLPYADIPARSYTLRVAVSEASLVVSARTDPPLLSGGVAATLEGLGSAGSGTGSDAADTGAIRYSLLDWPFGGRQVVTLRLQNVVSSRSASYTLGHVELTLRVPAYARWSQPLAALLLVAAVLAALALARKVCARSSRSIVSASEGAEGAGVKPKMS